MAYGKLAEAYIQIHADTTQFGKELDKGLKEKLRESQKEADNFGKRLRASFGDGGKAAEQFRKALLPAVGALSAVGLGAFKAAQAASDLGEEQAKAGQIFGEGAKQLNEFAEAAAQSIGQSQRQALNAASTFGIFGKSAGLAGTELVDFSKRFTVLASDLASFNNTSVDEAIISIGAALRGESEPIRRYGVLLDDATLRQTAFEMGIIDSIKNALTPQQKALAASEEIFRQTQTAQGDFARTADGLANSQRILAAEFQNAQVALGQAFLPAVQFGVTLLTGLARAAQANTPLFLALGAAIATVATIIIGVNVAMKAYNAITILTRGLNQALGTSFTRLQTSLGVIGVALAAATAVYGLLATSKKDTTSATEDLISALQLEEEAQWDAIAATLTANDELREAFSLFREQGITLAEVEAGLRGTNREYIELTQVLLDAAAAGAITNTQFETYIQILGDTRDGLIEVTEAQKLANAMASNAPLNMVDQFALGIASMFKEPTEDAKEFTGGVSKVTTAVDKMRQKVKEARTAIRDTFDTALKAGVAELDRARQAFDAFADEVATSIRSTFSFGQAQQEAIANSEGLTQALVAQAEAQEAYNQAIMQPDMAQVIQAQNDLARATQAVMDAQQRPMTFFEQLNQQANRATRFGQLVQELIGRGLTESALQQVLAAGVDAGTAIAEELLSGADNTLINQANRLQATLDKVATETGAIAAQRFRSQGVAMGEQLVAGINDAISRVQIQLKSKGLTPKQIKKLQRDFAVEIGFNLSTGELPALANGAIVRRPTTALIGESGAEVVVPITRPARALELLEASGLASLARANGGSAVSIQNATFVQPTDVDLLAQKVNAAAIARSLIA